MIYSEKATKFSEISIVDLTVYYIGQIYCGDFTKFCDLPRIYQLYINQHWDNSSVNLNSGLNYPITTVLGLCNFAWTVLHLLVFPHWIVENQFRQCLISENCRADITFFLPQFYLQLVYIAFDPKKCTGTYFKATISHF